MAISLENSTRLAEIRRRVLAGEATIDELKEGIKILRQDRTAAASASASAKSKAAPVDTGALLANLRSIATTPIKE